MSRVKAVSDRTFYPVTAEHIAQGIPGSSANCPVALALDGWVTNRYIDVALRTYRASAAIARRITAFDDGAGMEPFTVYLDHIRRTAGVARGKEGIPSGP